MKTPAPDNPHTAIIIALHALDIAVHVVDEPDTKDQLARAVFAWIAAWYNSPRRHSALAMAGPAEFEAFLDRESGAHLVRPARKNSNDPASSPAERALLRMRQWIEALFDTLKGQLSLEQHGARTSRGVFAGTNTPFQKAYAAAGNPTSAVVGTSGRVGARLSELTASARTFPSLINGSAGAIGRK